MEIGAEAPLLPEKEYVNAIAVAVRRWKILSDFFNNFERNVRSVSFMYERETRDKITAHGKKYAVHFSLIQSKI